MILLEREESLYGNRGNIQIICGHEEDGRLPEDPDGSLRRTGKEGKLPDDIKSFMDTMKNGNGNTDTNAQVDFLENGLKLFEQHSDLFDGKIEEIVKKYESTAEEVGKIASSLNQK